MGRPLVLALLALLLAGCARTGPVATVTPPTAAPAAFALREVASGFEEPLLLVSAHDGTGTLYVVEQTGRVWTLDHRLFLNLSGKTAPGGERGLLGLAFAPDFAASGVVYASYTDLNGDSILERYHTRGDAPPDLVLKVDQPYPNHNGGDVVFGPDGWLWYGLGDGGSGGDPQANGQNPDALLASLLRLDVSHGNATPEIWAKGLRNPWRFSFDRANGDLWIGDVGQDRWEEIDHVAAPLRPGLNFGWNAYEGNHAYPGGVPPFSAVTPPVAEYSHDEGCSVTGGYVYRGAAIPSLVGAYLFSDYCSGHLWTLRPSGSDWSLAQPLDAGASVSSFGEDDAGELYVVDHGGRILKIVPG